MSEHHMGKAISLLLIFIATIIIGFASLLIPSSNTTEIFLTGFTIFGIGLVTVTLFTYKAFWNYNQCKIFEYHLIQLNSWLEKEFNLNMFFELPNQFYQWSNKCRNQKDCFRLYLSKHDDALFINKLEFLFEIRQSMDKLKNLGLTDNEIKANIKEHLISDWQGRQNQYHDEQKLKQFQQWWKQLSVFIETEYWAHTKLDFNIFMNWWSKSNNDSAIEMNINNVTKTLASLHKKLTNSDESHFIQKCIQQYSSTNSSWEDFIRFVNNIHNENHTMEQFDNFNKRFEHEWNVHLAKHINIDISQLISKYCQLNRNTPMNKEMNELLGKAIQKIEKINALLNTATLIHQPKYQSLPTTLIANNVRELHNWLDDSCKNHSKVLILIKIILLWIFVLRH